MTFSTRLLRSAKLRKPPRPVDLTGLRVGDLVVLWMEFEPDKLFGEEADNERFWVKILDITKNRTFLGKIEEDMVYVAYHGLDQGDEVSFSTEHIFQVKG